MGHAHLLDDEGRQHLVRHGFLPERDVMTGIGKVTGSGSSGARPWGEPGWLKGQFQLVACAAIFAQGQSPCMKRPRQRCTISALSGFCFAKPCRVIDGRDEEGGQCGLRFVC